MVTKEQAIKAGETFRGEFQHVTALQADKKTPMRCRVNGKCKTWKTRPDDFQLPVKQGWKGSGYITPENAHEWIWTGA